MRTAAWGQWPSPLGPADVTASRRSPSGLVSGGGFLYWAESRPSQGGRHVVVRCRADGPGSGVADTGAGDQRGGRPEDVTPLGVSVRSQVYGYGGGAWCLLPAADPSEAPGGHRGVEHRGPALAYVDNDDQRVWWLGPGGPRLLGPAVPGGAAVVGGAAGGAAAGGTFAHGDLRATPDGRWVLAVRERVAGGGATRDIVAYRCPGPASAPEAAAGQPIVLCGGRDFFAAPRPDPSGRMLAWVCWDHPDMSWDASELWVGRLSGTGERLVVTGAERVAGGRHEGADGVSVGQPLWCADGSLVFACDAGGWWQPWRWRPGGRPECLSDDEAEVHAPDWQLGQATMADLGTGLIACRRRAAGRDHLGVLDTSARSFAVVDQPCVSVTALCAHRGGVAWLGSTPFAPAAPWWMPFSGRAASDSGRSTGHRSRLGAGGAEQEGEPGTRGGPRSLGCATPLSLAPESVSVAQPFTFTGRRGEQVHGLRFLPRLEGWAGPPARPPPLVVMCHGGPTGSAEPGFDPVVQMLTTRGYAVVSVDYAGSSGYGRAYRQKLLGRWGIDDVDDCVDAAVHAVELGWADSSKMAVRGSSAGGFTALGALVRADVFGAAVSWYGVTDLAALARSTHDFESRYTERLVGLPPDAEDEYRHRSPAHRVGDIAAAVLLFQGTDDPVVPAEQAEVLAGELRRLGRRCELLTFPGEGHGFGRAETLTAAFDAELAFYRRELAGDRRP